MQENCKEQFQVRLVGQAQNLGASTLQTADGLIFFDNFFIYFSSLFVFDENLCYLLPKHTIKFIS